MPIYNIITYTKDSANKKITVCTAVYLKTLFANCITKFFNSDAHVCASLQILKSNVLQLSVNFTKYQIMKNLVNRDLTSKSKQLDSGYSWTMAQHMAFKETKNKQ